MKITNRNIGTFVGFLLIFTVAGTLGWELIEVLLHTGGLNLELSAGPVGFDIGVLSLYIMINPGSLLGLAGGWLLFKKI